MAESRDAREQLSTEQERLTGRISEREAEIADLKAELEAIQSAQGEDVLAPAAGIDGTNLLVRYQAKAEATLANGLEGQAGDAAVDRNLQVEWQPNLDAAAVTIEAQPFDAFLRDSAPDRFAAWLVSGLPFELRDTRADGGLVDQYEPLPEIDRIELPGEIPCRQGKARNERPTCTASISSVGMG